MNDVFIEKIVPRKKSGTDYLKIFGLILAYFILIFIFIFFLAEYVMFLLPLVFIGGAWLLYMFITNMNVELEYIVTNGDLDIDAIYAQRKRKRQFSAKAKDFELMAHTSDSEYKGLTNNKSLKVFDASSNTHAPNTWFIVTQHKGQRTLVLLEPDERMLTNLRRFNPSRIRYNPTVGLGG